MSSVLDVVLVVAGIAWVVARRLLGQPVTTRSLVLVPVVLTVVGLSQLRDVHQVSTPLVLVTVASVLLSVVLGLLRGTTVRLSERDGGPFMRYSVLTLGLWGLNIAAKLALFPLGAALGGDVAAAAGTTTLAAIGIGTIAESLVVMRRVVRSGWRLPFDLRSDRAAVRTGGRA